MKTSRIAVLASTRGTDLQAIIDEMKAKRMSGIKLAIVISDKKDCYALQRAREQGYKTAFINPKNLTREAFDRRLQKILEAENIDPAKDIIVLVGYMRILTPEFVQHYKNRIINIHPALLPKFGGKNLYGQNVHEAVLKAGEKETGMTIHYVDEGIDSGKILFQKRIPITQDDTPDTLKTKVQELEKRWYPEVIKKLCQRKNSNSFKAEKAKKRSQKLQKY